MSARIHLAELTALDAFAADLSREHERPFGRSDALRQLLRESLAEKGYLKREAGGQ